MDENPHINDKTPQTNRLEHLSAKRKSTAENINKNYSRFIRKVQIILPVMAIILIGLIIGWDKFETDKIVPVKAEDIAPNMQQEIGKNELINPQFESLDKKKQPFTLTAEKAIQEDGTQGEMLLEKPAGTLKLNSGKNITIEANKGIYLQEKQTLDLKDNVILSHSDGYNMTTNILHVDMGASTAWSDDPVNIKGPKGTIDATGVHASSEDEKVIFKGPAKMLLNLDNSNVKFGEILP